MQMNDIPDWQVITIKPLLIIYLFCFCFTHFRGISSTVRRCIEKETGREFAAKIIDLGVDGGDVSSEQMMDATRQEIAILRQVMGHPYISKSIVYLYIFNECKKWIKKWNRQSLFICLQTKYDNNEGLYVYCKQNIVFFFLSKYKPNF